MSAAGVQAVDVFFVLSGFVIAHVCATRENTLYDYAISRAARIYSVAIPALILTIILDAVGMSYDPTVYQEGFQEISGGLLVRSLFFIGEQWNAHRFAGSNSPYWSLGFEVWYYIAFAAFMFAPKPWRWAAAACVLLFIGPKVALMFPVWLMGVAVYRFTTVKTISKTVGWMCFVAPILLFAVYQQLPHSPLQPFMPVSLQSERIISTAQDYFIAGLFCVHLIGFSGVSGSFSAGLERFSKAIRWVSGATFSLYLAHLPIMHCLSALSPLPKSSTAHEMLLIFGTVLGCFLFAECSERRKTIWRLLIVKMVKL